MPLRFSPTEYFKTSASFCPDLTPPRSQCVTSPFLMSAATWKREKLDLLQLYFYTSQSSWCGPGLDYSFNAVCKF